MTTTKQQAYAFAQAAHALRPDWDVHGTAIAIGRVKNHPAGDVALAVIRAALDPTAQTPGVIPTDGSHWHEGTTRPTTTRQPLPGEDCPAHPGQWPHACAGCAADRHAGDTTRPGRRTPTERITARVTDLRNSLRTTRDRCPCGRLNCTDHRTQEDAT